MGVWNSNSELDFVKYTRLVRKYGSESVIIQERLGPLFCIAFRNHAQNPGLVGGSEFVRVRTRIRILDRSPIRIRGKKIPEIIWQQNLIAHQIIIIQKKFFFNFNLFFQMLVATDGEEVASVLLLIVLRFVNNLATVACYGGNTRVKNWKFIWFK